jgi:hypothetical protein
MDPNMPKKIRTGEVIIWSRGKDDDHETGVAHLINRKQENAFCSGNSPPSAIRM